jgi:hypothetical protein
MGVSNEQDLSCSAAGLTTDPRANPDDPASLVINTGARSQVIVISDPITGGTPNVAVFDNANILDTHATSVGARP